MTNTLITQIVKEFEEFVRELHKSKNFSHVEMNKGDDHTCRPAIEEIIRCLYQLDQDILIYRLEPTKWGFKMADVEYYLRKHVNDDKLGCLYQDSSSLIDNFIHFLNLGNS